MLHGAPLIEATPSLWGRESGASRWIQPKIMQQVAFDDCSMMRIGRSLAGKETLTLHSLAIISNLIPHDTCFYDFYEALRTESVRVHRRPAV